MGRTGVELGWAAWRTGGRSSGRRLQGDHPCLVDMAVPLLRRVIGARGARFGGARRGGGWWIGERSQSARGKLDGRGGCATVEFRCGWVGGQELHRRVDRL